MVHEKSGKYRRTRLFVMTLGYSRKSVRCWSFAPVLSDTVTGITHNGVALSVSTIDALGNYLAGAVRASSP